MRNVPAFGVQLELRNDSVESRLADLPVGPLVRQDIPVTSEESAIDSEQLLRRETLIERFVASSEDSDGSAEFVDSDRSAAHFSSSFDSGSGAGLIVFAISRAESARSRTVL